MLAISTFETPQQTVTLQSLPEHGRILDIGAGGEGIVARLGGRAVCAVDIRMDEIREARIHDPPASWFVADGRSLCFGDTVFEMATFWFSMGYLRDRDNKIRALEETFRVLQQGGTLSIKGARITCDEEKLIIRILYIFPDGTVSSVGYGVRGRQGQTIASMREMIESVGFVCRTHRDHGHWFEIEALKPFVD